MYSKLDGQSRQVRTRRGTAEHRVHHVGPLPILRHFLDRMAFERIVGSCLGTGRETPHHAQTLAVLVQNILLSPSPLYRIAEWTAPFSAAALGLNRQEKDSINDDRVARMLDALVSVSARSLFFRMALHAIKQFEIDTRRIHHDTTTVTFHGRYVASIAEPRITHGINKDHRPDLKQLVFGLNVSSDMAAVLAAPRPTASCRVRKAACSPGARSGIVPMSFWSKDCSIWLFFGRRALSIPPAPSAST